MIRTRNDKELNAMGLMVDPDNPTDVVPLKKAAEGTPDESWSLEQLAEFATGELKESRKLEREATFLARQSTVRVFWAGRALSLAFRKAKAGGQNWTDWLEERNIPRTTAYEAMKLAKRAKVLGAVAHLSVTDAKEKFGVTKPKKPRRKGPSQPSAKKEGGKPSTNGKARSAKPVMAVASSDVPPPKEDADSPLTVLVAINNRLEMVLPDIQTIDWNVESAEDYRREIENLNTLLAAIGKEVPNGR